MEDTSCNRPKGGKKKKENDCGYFEIPFKCFDLSSVYRYAATAVTQGALATTRCRKECAESGVKLNQMAIFIHISIGYFSWPNILRNGHVD